MALTGSSSPHFYLARSRSTSLPPLSSSSSASGPSSSSRGMGVASFCSSLTWPNHALPSLALAFDEPSFFADLRVDINPIVITPSSIFSTSSSSSSNTTPSTTTTPHVQSSGTASPEECCRSHSRLNCNAGLADDNRSTPGGDGGDHGGGREEEVTPPPAHRETDEPGRDCVWVHRMVVAVHSPVFRSLLRHGGNGTRESREGVIDMRGPQHPPGRVVRCMLKMMYASPGLAIDELGHEPKLSDEWEFLLQLYKLAHLYQVEVVLDACTRRLKHILERKDNARPSHQQSIQQQKQSRRGSKVATTHQLPLEPLDAVSAEMTEEDEERTRQTCFALELLAFLLHVKQAETSDSNGALGSDDVRGYLRGEQASSPAAAAAKGRSVSAPEPSVTARSDDSVADEAGGVSVSDDACERKQQRKDKSLVDGSGGGGEAEEAVDAGEQREELLVRMLDYHLYPQLAMIVQHIRCEDVLTLQHLLHLSVCCRQTSPSSPTTASLTPQWPGHATIQRFKP